MGQIKKMKVHDKWAQTTDTQWRHKSKISEKIKEPTETYIWADSFYKFYAVDALEKLGRCCRQNMLRPYHKIWDWGWLFSRAVKAIFSLGIRSPCKWVFDMIDTFNFWLTYFRSLRQKSKNNFVLFLSQMRTRKFAFEIYRPLWECKVGYINYRMYSITKYIFVLRISCTPSL